MRLADYTDYSLRVLMYCAARPHERVTISDLALLHGVSRNHLTKVITDLGRQGLLHTTRGRGGGVQLAQPPAHIRLGDVVRAAETDWRLVECFDRARNQCALMPTCKLKHALSAAMQAFFDELDTRTLADLLPTANARRAPAATAAVVQLPRRRHARTNVPPQRRPRHG